MAKIEYRRDFLILDLCTKFSNDLTESLAAFTVEEKIDVLELLYEAAKRLEKNEDFETVYHAYIDPILTKYKSKSRELFNRRLTDYFVQDSVKLIDLMHEKKINDPENQHLTDEEYKKFMWSAKNQLFNERHFTYLRMTDDTENSASSAEVLEKEEVIITEENKEFTTRRRALFLHYLDKHFHISVDRKPLAEIAHFLTGNNEDNLYKHFLNPLKVKGDDNEKGEKALKKDLIYVKRQFERLDLKEIIKIIDKDFDSI